MKKSLEASTCSPISWNRRRFGRRALRRILALGREPDRLAVLVGAGEKEHVLAALAVVAGEDVGGDRRVRVPEMGLRAT